MALLTLCAACDAPAEPAAETDGGGDTEANDDPQDDAEDQDPPAGSDGTGVLYVLGLFDRIDRFVPGQAPQPWLQLTSNDEGWLAVRWPHFYDFEKPGLLSDDEYVFHVRDGSGERPALAWEIAFTLDDGYPNGGAPSPSGQRLAIETRQSEALGAEFLPHIYALTADGTALLHAIGFTQPSWIDEQSLLVSSGDGLAILEIGASVESPIGPAGLAHPGVPVVDPALSPDGRTVAFVQNDELWTIGLDGAALTRLTAPRLGIGWPAWTVDGKQLALSQSQCPGLGSTTPRPRVVLVAADARDQDVDALPSPVDDEGEDYRACGPYYWAPR